MSRWFGDIFFVHQQFALSLFSLSLVGMERELPSAFLLPGSPISLYVSYILNVIQE